MLGGTFDSRARQASNARPGVSPRVSSRRAKINPMSVISDRQRRQSTTLPADLAEAVDKVAIERGIPRQKLVEIALRRLLETPDTPPEAVDLVLVRSMVSLRAAEVYEALVAAYTGLGPVMTRPLAGTLGIHRGNVDRHLAVLRDHGLARRDGHGHIPMIVSHQEAAAS